MQTLGELAEQALRVVREAPIMAYDTETSGLDWKIHHPVGYVITTDDFNVYVPIRHGGGGNLLDGSCAPLRTPTDTNVTTHRWERELAAAFEERRRRGFLTIGHNLKFDMHMSANRGILLGRICEDTGINAAMLNEFMRSFSLENCCQDAGVPAKKGAALYEHMARTLGIPLPKNAWEIMEHFWRVPGNDEFAVDYAMADGTATLGLRKWQRPQITQQGMDVIHEVESQLIWTVFRMERRGIKIDLSRIKEVEALVETRIMQSKAKFGTEFNPNSGAQVKKAFEVAGITSGWPMTDASTKFPDGQPSFNEKYLKTVPLGRDIVTYRKLLNLGSKFIGPLKEKVHNGRVYASLNQMKGDEFGTVSGRFSCSDPNLQAVTKHDQEMGALFRSMFIPDEGMEMSEADYSQCEPRLFAHYSKEPALLDGYNGSPVIDMHGVVAKAFQVDRGTTAKRMNMGILTGMFPETFAGHMGWTLDKAKDEWNNWFALFPLIRDFQDHCKGVFKTTGFIRTILGRRCHLDHPRFAYRGTSRVIQGGNADIIKYMLLKVDRWLEELGDPVHLLMTIHDSFLFQNPPTEEGRAIVQQMLAMWTNVQVEPFNLRVPFVMDVHTGKNWAEATYGQLS